MRWWKALLAAAAAFGAVLAAAVVTRERRKVAQLTERAQTVQNITGNTRQANEAHAAARKHEDRANQAASKAQARLDRLARQDRTLEELVDAWNK